MQDKKCNCTLHVYICLRGSQDSVKVPLFHNEKILNRLLGAILLWESIIKGWLITDRVSPGDNMVWLSFLESGETERKKKNIVAKVSQLRVPLCFSFFFCQIILQKVHFASGRNPIRHCETSSSPPNWDLTWGCGSRKNGISKPLLP